MVELFKKTKKNEMELNRSQVVEKVLKPMSSYFHGLRYGTKKNTSKSTILLCIKVSLKGNLIKILRKRSMLFY